MGFDVLHLNLHKTFSTPHGGGGPGAGPVGVGKGLEEFLPNPVVCEEKGGTYKQTIKESALGSISSTLGNYGILIRACAYLLTIGRDHIAMAGKLSVLNANYIKECLKSHYNLPIEGICKHEFVFDGMKEEYAGPRDSADYVKTLDVAKRLLDYGYHAPTIYFPLLFHEAMMIEPTEDESKETLDGFIATLKKIAEEAKENKELVKSAPHNTPIRRLDDVKAVKASLFTYKDLKAQQ